MVGCYMNSIRLEASRTFRTKKREYLKTELMDLKNMVRTKYYRPVQRLKLI
jgi:hypothetical protein